MTIDLDKIASAPERDHQKSPNRPESISKSLIPVENNLLSIQPGVSAVASNSAVDVQTVKSQAQPVRVVKKSGYKTLFSLPLY